MSIELLTTVEACEKLGVSKKTLLRYCKQGLLAHTVLPGGDFRFKPSIIELFIANREKARSTGDRKRIHRQNGHKKTKMPIFVKPSLDPSFVGLESESFLTRNRKK